MIVDLGCGGARVRCSEAASVTDVGEIITISFALPGEPVRVELEATVRSVGSDHLAIQFGDGVPDEVREYVDSAHAVFRRAAPKPVG